MQATKAQAKGPSKQPVHILVVDDERSICELLEITFRKEGHRVEVAHDVPAAKRKLESQIFDIVVSDVRMPGESGVDLLKLTKEIAPECFFLLITGVPTVETAIAAINSGADRYVIKDHELVDQLRRAVREVSESLKWKKEAGYLRRELRHHRLGTISSVKAPKMREIFDMIQTVAPQTSRVLITGESGTGEDPLPGPSTENSQRAQNPFITINCGAFPETLLESELFGYMKGAFTGAAENRQGLFQAAHGGTLFMDEIGNMSLTMQVKLCTASCKKGKVRPVGSNEESDVDVRIIAATNKDFEKEIAEGASARTSIIGSASFLSSCRPCASAAKTFLCWPGIFWRVFARQWKSRSRESRPRPCASSKPTIGQATFANWKTPWSAPWPWKLAPKSPFRCCRTALRDTLVLVRHRYPRDASSYPSKAWTSRRRWRMPRGVICRRPWRRETAFAHVPQRCTLKITYRSFRHYAKKHNL